MRLQDRLDSCNLRKALTPYKAYEAANDRFSRHESTMILVGLEGPKRGEFLRRTRFGISRLSCDNGCARCHGYIAWISKDIRHKRMPLHDTGPSAAWWRCSNHVVLWIHVHIHPSYRYKLQDVAMSANGRASPQIQLSRHVSCTRSGPITRTPRVLQREPPQGVPCFPLPGRSGHPRL